MHMNVCMYIGDVATMLIRYRTKLRCRRYEGCKQGYYG